MLRVLPFLLLASPALAISQDEVLSARLLPGWQMADGHRMAAIELRLAPGWKTYWRAPGEIGLPPRFDWAGSENIAGARFHWPAPEVIDQGGMVTLGYHEGLILPVELSPQGAGPMGVSLRMELGICREVCMPAELRLSASFGAKGAPDPAITAALDRVPQAGAGVTCKVEPIEDGMRVTARIGAAGGVDPFVVFETADPTVWVGTAHSWFEGKTLVSQTDLVPPEGAPFALDRSGLTVTVLDRGGAVEMKGCPAG
jgi:DsbC/DsbD-like thiol-disulfide interchange protein